MKRKVIVNFKAYSQGCGEKASRLADKFSKVNDKIENEVVVAPDLIDTLRTTGNNLKVYGQHVDPVHNGRHTGNVTPEILKSAGASGTLLNHSERRIDHDKIEKALEKCRGTGLETVVCANSVEEVEKLSRMKPGYVAYEPPELIGGNLSVSEAKPEVIEEAVERTADGVETLTGAGIKDKEDVERSIELGCKGVLVASGVVKSDNPVETLEDLCEGL